MKASVMKLFWLNMKWKIICDGTEREELIIEGGGEKF